jgi:phage shock protein E
MKKIIFLVFATVLVLTACTSTKENNVEYKKITAQEAKQIIDNEKDIIILDVRTQEEYNEGYIKNALLIPDYDIEKSAPEKLQNKDAKILVYCRSGRRSAIAAKKLIEMGYTNVLDFGGIIDWKYEIIK